MVLRGDFISDAKLQRFWTEMINKESVNRAEWLIKHKELMDSCVDRKPIKPSDRPTTAELVEKIQKLRGPPIPPEIKHSKKSFVTKFPEIDAEKLKEKCKEFEMKQAEKDVKQGLYSGLSHFGEGRYRYLKKRAETSPELKWNFTQTSTQEYGWKLKDQVSYNKPKFGRGRIIKDSFYRNTGVMGTSSYIGSRYRNGNF